LKKSELVELMCKTRAEFDELLAELGTDQMTRNGVAGDWSIKDMLAHIAWYQREEAELFGETGVEASELWNVPQDPRNETLFELHRDQPLERTLTDFRQSFDKLIAAVMGLSDDELNTPGRFPGTTAERPPWKAIAIHSYEHDREHTKDIRTWMASRSPDQS
jgi:uncharacterized protein (TIGR03083 family)